MPRIFKNCIENDYLMKYNIEKEGHDIPKLSIWRHYGNKKRYYIQSAFSLPDDKKREQEKASLVNVNDSFKKIIIVKDVVKPLHDNDGILTMSIYDFLLNENSLEL